MNYLNKITARQQERDTLNGLEEEGCKIYVQNKQYPGKNCDSSLNGGYNILRIMKLQMNVIFLGIGRKKCIFLIFFSTLKENYVIFNKTV